MMPDGPASQISAAEPLQGFQLYTPGARRLYHFDYHRDQHLLAAEARRTLDNVAASSRNRIAKGTLAEAEAAQVALLWLAIAEDLEAQVRWLAERAGASGWSLADRLRELRAANRVSWAGKVQALRREIQRRRDHYPEQERKGQLTRDDGKTQLERLEAAHDLYWRHGFAFDGTREELSAHGAVIQDRALTDCGPAKVPSSCTSEEAYDELNRRTA